MLKFHDPELNILISYAYFKPEMVDQLKAVKFKHKLILDSGAFTVWKKGKTIDVRDYALFLKSLPITPWRYFNLDVIGNPEKSLENYCYLLDQELTPIPIFTRGESYSMIDHYYNTSEVVGIGGLVGTKNKNNVVKKVMRAVGDRKVHWLGFTSFDYLKHYKPYMCDSTSWSRAARFADLNLYAGNGLLLKLRKKDFISKPPQVVFKALLDLGFDAKDLSVKKNWSSNHLFSIGFASEIRRMLDVKSNIGTNMFLACCSPEDIRNAIFQFKKITGIKQ